MIEVAIAGGTTLVVVGVGNRVALAADRLSHFGLAEGSARASGTTTKVQLLTDDLMFGSHGMSGLDSPGVALVDFKSLMAEELKELQWTETLATAREFGDRLGSAIHAVYRP